MSLVFLRHLPTTFNLGGPEKERVRAQLDPPVPAESLHLATEIAERFRGIPLDEVYSSDRYAASLLAQQLSHVTGAPLTLTPALRSWNLGDLQGQLVKDTKHQIRAYMQTPDVRVPGGESWHEFVHRYLAFLRPHWRQPGYCALVTHGRNLMVARSWLAAGAEGDTLDNTALLAEYAHIPHGGYMMATGGNVLDGIC